MLISHHNTPLPCLGPSKELLEACGAIYGKNVMPLLINKTFLQRVVAVVALLERPLIAGV